MYVQSTKVLEDSPNLEMKEFNMDCLERLFDFLWFSIW